MRRANPESQRVALTEVFPENLMQMLDPESLGYLMLSGKTLGQPYRSQGKQIKKRYCQDKTHLASQCFLPHLWYEPEGKETTIYPECQDYCESECIDFFYSLLQQLQRMNQNPEQYAQLITKLDSKRIPREIQNKTLKIPLLEFSSTINKESIDHMDSNRMAQVAQDLCEIYTRNIKRFIEKKQKVYPYHVREIKITTNNDLIVDEDLNVLLPNLVTSVKEIDFVNQRNQLVHPALQKVKFTGEHITIPLLTKPTSNIDYFLE